MPMRALSITLALSLAACGGGGGSAGTGAAAPTPQLTLETSALSFDAPRSGPAPAAQLIRGTVSGSPAAVHVRVEQTTNGIEPLAPPTVSGSSATSSVQPKNPSGLADGVYTDTITVRACPTAACTTQFAGSPATVTVTYTVGIPVSPATLSVTAIEGAAPAPQTLALSWHGGSAAWTAQSAAPWLTVEPSGSALPDQLGVAFAAQPAGTLNATIVIAVGGETREVPVAYTVLPLLQASELSPMLVASTTPLQTQTRSATIASRQSGRQVAWSATVDVDWIELTRASGTTGGTRDILGLRLDPEAILAMRNGEYQATVTVTSSAAGVSPIELPLSLRLDRTHLDSVAAHVVAAGVPGRLILRGERLVEGPLDRVTIGGTPATSFTEFGPDRIEVAYPALPAGRHVVRLERDSGTPIGTSAELVVMDASNYLASGVSAEAAVAGLTVFDPERESIYVVSREQGIEAFRRTAGGWTVQRSSATWPAVSAAALSNDGRTLLLLSNGDFVHVDPATLAQTGTADAPVDFGSTLPEGALAGLDTGHFLYAVSGQLLRYNPYTGASTPIGDPVGYIPYLNPTPAGNLVLSGNDGNYHLYRSGNAAASVATPAGTLHDAAADRFGERWALVEETTTTPTPELIVTNGSFQAQGRVPLEGLTGDAALSADGRWLYQSQYRPAAEIRVYDLSVAPVNGVYPLARTIAVPFDQAGRLFLSPDESELILVGTRVVPIALAP